MTDVREVADQVDGDPGDAPRPGGLMFEGLFDE
jgi:hypothetical protein